MKRSLATSGRRVVITGLGCVSPIGNTVEDSWNALLEGRSGGGRITHFDVSKLSCQIACEVKGFNAEQYINKKDIRRMDRFIQLGLAAAYQALEHSGLTVENTPAEKIGTLMSSGMGGLPMIEEQHKIGLEKPGRITPFFIPAVIPNLVAGQLSISKGLKGPNFCIVSACASSTHSLGEGTRMIERGDIEACVVGGSEATICLLGIAGFANMRALSERNDSPETASRPFDKTRDGFVMGEGGAALVIESLENAQRRGAKILAEVAGYAADSDAFHMTNPTEDGEGPARCMQMALDDAGLKTTDVDYINMHGTSTPAGDIAETRAIKRLFGEHAKTINCNSTKSMTGHLLGAAGAIEAVFTTLAVARGICPPTINIREPDPDCDLNYTADKAVKRDLNVGMSNSFGFGGTNATVIIKKYKA